ncbi:hypothetical protein Dxin01_00848 [Deinococcus xinjiangensis]|uniref:HTH cro/C1-type domain-containing protein n=1 Tax=Deinococcus xinjiangensis TaxID=457454 RepID=A0ABP9V780_9DEIO
MSRVVRQAIREALKARGITQEQLAELLTELRRQRDPAAPAVSRVVINRALNTNTDLPPLLQDALSVLQLEVVVEPKKEMTPRDPTDSE